MAVMTESLPFMDVLLGRITSNFDGDNNSIYGSLSIFYERAPGFNNDGYKIFLNIKITISTTH